MWCMEKEWFNGCVANGLQFRLDGYMITNSGVTYHIGIKNISAHKIEIGNKVYFRFNSKERRKKNEFGQYYLEMGNTIPYEDVWDYDCLRDVKTQKSVFTGNVVLMPSEEYLFKCSWNGEKELRQDEVFRPGCVKEILSEHDFYCLQLKISNFVNMHVKPSGKEHNYDWYVSDKAICQDYGRYVPVTSEPNTEDGILTSLLSQDSQLEEIYGVNISSANVHKNEDTTCDVVFELRPSSKDYSRNVRVTACVYNRSKKPVLLQSLDIRDFENFNVYAIKGLHMLPTDDISRIFIFPTKLV